MPRPRVYLAGPDVFFPDAPGRFFELRTRLNALGMEGVPPCDGGLSIGAPRTAETAQRIARGNRDLIQSCDAVLANLNPWRGPEPDSGTVWESGFACAAGKLCVGYVDTDEEYLVRVVRAQPASRRSTDGWADAEGCVIEDFGLPLNLMLVYGAELVRGGMTEAISVLAQKLAK